MTRRNLWKYEDTRNLMKIEHRKEHVGSKVLEYSNFFSLFFQKHRLLLKHIPLNFLENAEDFYTRITSSLTIAYPTGSSAIERLDRVLVADENRGKLNVSQPLQGLEMPSEENLETLGKDLRLKNNLELSRIAEADLCGIDNFTTTVKKISYLADAVVIKAFHYLSASRFGLSVIAMGKLGGSELNYSSDIDLVFCTEKKLTAHENVAATKLVQKFLWLLGNPTDEGIAYRVDLKIRPYGNVGSVHISNEALASYYKSKASLWEWQALLKARVIVGAASSKKLLQSLKTQCIFQNEIPFAVLVKKISEMKDDIEKKLRNQELKRLGHRKYVEQHSPRKDVKLGLGGIRDIEFIVQFLQIYHSGFANHIDAKGTIHALRLLANRAILEPKTATLLSDNYVFLRRVEHLLQLKDMLSERNLPTETMKLYEIAALLSSREENMALNTSTDTVSSDVPSKNHSVGGLHLNSTADLVHLKLEEKKQKRIGSVDNVERSDDELVDPVTKIGTESFAAKSIFLRREDKGGEGKVEGASFTFQPESAIEAGSINVFPGLTAHHTSASEQAWHCQQKASGFLQMYNTTIMQNREVFDEIFKHSMYMLNKLNSLRSIVGEKMQEILSSHFHSLDSAYFSVFSSSEIARHVETLASFKKNEPCSVQISSVTGTSLNLLRELISDNPNVAKNKGFAQLDIISQDKKGMLSTLCGLAASFGLHIVRGHSFVYSKASGIRLRLLEQRAGERRKSQRRKKNVEKAFTLERRNAERRIISRRKGILKSVQLKKPFKNVLICSMQGFFQKGSHIKNFDHAVFYSEVERYLELIARGDVEKAMEGVMLRVAQRAEIAKQKIFQPPQVFLDNNCDPSVTVLRVQGEDYFLFLYFFTASLSQRGFNMQQVSFSTSRSHVENTFFITESSGKKISAPDRLQELHTTALIVGYFSAVLPHAPSPSIAFKVFHKNIAAGGDYAELLKLFLNNPKKGRQLGRLLGSSEQIWEDFLRTESQHLLFHIGASKSLLRRRSRKYLQLRWKKENANSARLSITDRKGKNGRAQESVPLSNNTQVRNGVNSPRVNSSGTTNLSLPDCTDLLLNLNRFKNDMLFEVDLRLLSGLCKSFPSFCREISNIGDVVFSHAFVLAQKKVSLSNPTLAKHEGKAILLGLGKWGGCEMGYASDLEMMLVYSCSEKTLSIAKRYYEKVAHTILEAFPCKRHGIFELDLRLRPDGESSPLAVPFSRFGSYYSHGSKSTKAHNFERMALTRLRVISGNKLLASKVMHATQEFVYSSYPFNFAEYYKLRGRQVNELVEKSQLNLKYSKGGLVDIEYTVQAFVIAFGHRNRKLRSENIEKSIVALHQQGIWSLQTTVCLLSNYFFLRYSINCLRIVRGDARDLLLPSVGSLQFTYWYRRMKTFGALQYGVFLMPPISQLVLTPLSNTSVEVQLANVKKQRIKTDSILKGKNNSLTNSEIFTYFLNNSENDSLQAGKPLSQKNEETTNKIYGSLLEHGISDEFDGSKNSGIDDATNSGMDSSDGAGKLYQHLVAVMEVTNNLTQNLLIELEKQKSTH